MPLNQGASELRLRAYCELTHRVFVAARFYSGGELRIPDEQLFDLMDAMHNVPLWLAGIDPYFTEEFITQALARYDAKWAGQGKFRFSLVAMLNEALNKHTPRASP